MLQHYLCSQCVFCNTTQCWPLGETKTSVGLRTHCFLIVMRSQGPGSVSGGREGRVALAVPPCDSGDKLLLMVMCGSSVDC